MNKAVLIHTGWYTFRLPAKRYKRMCCIHQRVQQLLLFFLLFTISIACPIVCMCASHRIIHRIGHCICDIFDETVHTLFYQFIQNPITPVLL